MLKCLNRHRSKSIWVTSLLLCQNDSLMGVIKLAKGQIGHLYKDWSEMNRTMLKGDLPLALSDSFPISLYFLIYAYLNILVCRKFSLSVSMNGFFQRDQFLFRWNIGFERVKNWFINKSYRLFHASILKYIEASWKVNLDFIIGGL